MGLALAAVALLALGCEDEKPSGGLAVVVESDLSMPKDIDRIRLEVTQPGRTLRFEEHELGAGKMLVPAEFRVSPADDGSPVTIRVIGMKAGQLRIERSAITTIPTGSVAMLRMPLNYLCTGTATPLGTSTCGEGQTCKQGTCADASVDAQTLPQYESGPWTSAATGTHDSAQHTCFDVLNCFSRAARVMLDRQSCSFTLDTEEPGHVSVGIKLPPGSDGVCGAGSCWIALDEGAEGWTRNGMSFSLPPSLCRDRSDGSSFTLVVGNMCGAKVPSTPPCGAWSSASTPSDTSETIGPPMTPPGGTPPPPVGPSCAGLSYQPCGDCGQQRRTCRNGVWSEWGECFGQGLCDPNEAESCGMNGNRVCLNMCEWGECTGQTCAGSAVEACGKCGTRRRTCINGEWSEWSACSDEGDCLPGQTQMCAEGGTQGCMGNCRWGACGDAACEGAPAQACGNCGTQTRTCDPLTMQWSEWGPCEQEGVCEANQTRVCGLSGMQVCGGLCQWDAACTGQVCEGPASQPCGNCGVQTRACDDTTGMWGAWSACTNEGVCQAGTTQTCGVGGTQLCLDSCQWSEECTGQTCTGPMTQSCGFCGMQSRECNGLTAQWGEWEACTGQGSCSPGTTRVCGTGGTQVCGDDCSWSPECLGQSCGTGPSVRACGRCGTQTRTCNGSTGQWSDWGPCTGQGVCTPDEVDRTACGPGGYRECSDSCQWSSCACDLQGGFTVCGDDCVDLQTSSLHCGDCGVSCGDRACRNGTCEPCPSGTHLCGTECRPLDDITACGDGCVTCPAPPEGSDVQCFNGACVFRCSDDAPDERSCPNCGTQSRTCDGDTGTWRDWGACVPAPTSTECGECLSGTQTRTCVNGQLTPWSDCTNAEPNEQSCGFCGTGRQRRSCVDNEWTDWSECAGGGACEPGSTRPCGNGGSQECTSQCAWGPCGGQSCGAGPSARSCGNCGTQTRTCDMSTGQWTDWSLCSGEGVCAPGATTDCGNGGTRQCTAACTWGTECTGQQCPDEPSSEACGMCGTRTRTCNTDTGQWSEWSACADQGVCAPGTTMDCGNGGTRQCTTACTWGTACTGQQCSDEPSSEVCGNCGTRTRTCNTDTGQWSQWSTCLNEGPCAPGETMSCENGGTRECTALCTWPEECTELQCPNEPSSEPCGMCGTRVRTCDTSTGEWSDWSTCMNQGQCMPGQTMACEGGGTRECTSACTWPDECTQLACPPGPTSRDCGNCGTQSRTCNTTTGQWNDWSTCTGEGVCEPGATMSCGNGGSRTCTDLCEWPTQCLGQSCGNEPSSRPCGNCGTESRTCNPETGEWSDWSDCSDQGECSPNDSRSCGANGTQQCDEQCSWGACMGDEPPAPECSGPTMEPCGPCDSGMRTRTCVEGMWSDWGECQGIEGCMPGMMQACGNGGMQTCSDSCAWDDCMGQACEPGPTMEVCGNCGTRTRTCDNGQWSDWSTCIGEGECMPGMETRCGRSGTQLCSDTCSWGACQNQMCQGQNTQPCGNCGTQTRECNPATGDWSEWGECVDQGECAPETMQECEGGNQICTRDCTWGECELDEVDPDGGSPQSASSPAAIPA